MRSWAWVKHAQTRKRRPPSAPAELFSSSLFWSGYFSHSWWFLMVYCLGDGRGGQSGGFVADMCTEQCPLMSTGEEQPCQACAPISVSWLIDYIHLKQECIQGIFCLNGWSTSSTFCSTFWSIGNIWAFLNRFTNTKTFRNIKLYKRPLFFLRPVGYCFLHIMYRVKGENRSLL